MLLRWPYTFAVALSLAVGATTIYYSQTLNVGLKDPEGFLGPAYIRLPMIALLIFAAGIVPPACRWPTMGRRARAMSVLRATSSRPPT